MLILKEGLPISLNLTAFSSVRFVIIYYFIAFLAPKYDTVSASLYK